MTRTLCCAAAVVLLCSCELFGGIDVDDLPYRQAMLWRLPSVLTQGVPGVDASSVYALDVQRTLYAVDRRQGTVRWSGPSQQTGLAYGVSRVGDVVVAAAGALVAYDTASGAVVWQNTIADGLGGLPFASGDSTIFPSSRLSATGTVYALSASQRILWQAVIIPPDSSMGAADQVRAFTPELRNGTLVYSFDWWRGAGVTVPKGGVAVVDARTGGLRWSRMLPVDIPNASTAPSDAVTDGVRLFVTSKDGRVFAFSLADGALTWTAGPATPSTEAGATDIRPLTVTDGTVVVGSGRSVLTGYHAQTGAIRWQVDTKNGGTAQVHRFGTASVLALHYNGGLSLRKVATGRLLWIVEPRRNDQRVSDFLVARDTVFASSPDAGLQAFRLVPR